jgi:hypothetical protein
MHMLNSGACAPVGPAHNFAMAEQFLKLLDSNAERFTFALIPETKEVNGIKKKGAGAVRQFHCTLAEFWPHVQRLNVPPHDYAAYVTINETDFAFNENGMPLRTAKNIVRVRALLCDADSAEITARTRAICVECGVEPSMRVRSSLDKAHSYWLVDDVELDEFTRPQKALATRFGSDQSVIDLPRIMRLPGTTHLKGSPRLVVLDVPETPWIYKVEHLVGPLGLELSESADNATWMPAPGKVLAPYEDDELSRGISNHWFDALDSNDKDEALGQMLDVCPDIALGKRQGWVDALMAAHASGAPHAEELAREWSRPYPKYTDAEFNENWKSFKFKVGGITIGWLIAAAKERGFDAELWRARADVARIAAQTGATASEASKLPSVGGKVLSSALPAQTILYVPGNMEEEMGAIDERLAADPYTFQSGSRLVSLRLPDASRLLPGVVSDGDMPTMLPTTSADVLYLADRDIWRGHSPGRAGDRGPKFRRIPVPRNVCKDYLELSRTKTGIRRLRGLARVPIIDDAGDIDFSEGYHAATGVFRDRTPNLNVPQSPTMPDCWAAIKTLLAPFWKYKFADQKLGRVLVITMILTAIERPFIRTAPMFAINGSMAGTGKGKLIRAVALLAFGTTPRFMNYGFNAEEFDKRIASMINTPAPCLVIDNANGKQISNDILEAVISEGEVDIRILGQTGSTHIENRSLIAATGNNLELSSDMTRRAIKIELEPRSPTPEMEVYEFAPEEYVAQHRDELLTAAFTIMRRFRQEVMPKTANTSAGSFPEWERRVRNLVMWLFKIDVAQQFVRNRENASDKQADAALLAALHAWRPGIKWEARDAEGICDELEQTKRGPKNPTPIGGPALAPQASGPAAAIQAKGPASALTKPTPTGGSAPAPQASGPASALTPDVAAAEALREYFGDHKINAKRIGNWARRVENAYIGGLRLTREKKREGHYWLRIDAIPATSKP